MRQYPTALPRITRLKLQLTALMPGMCILRCPVFCPFRRQAARLHRVCLGDMGRGLHWVETCLYPWDAHVQKMEGGQIALFHWGMRGVPLVPENVSLSLATACGCVGNFGMNVENCRIVVEWVFGDAWGEFTDEVAKIQDCDSN